MGIWEYKKKVGEEPMQSEALWQTFGLISLKEFFPWMYASTLRGGSAENSAKEFLQIDRTNKRVRGHVCRNASVLKTLAFGGLKRCW